MSVGEYHSSAASKEKYKEVLRIMFYVCSVKEYTGLVPKAKSSFSSSSLSNRLQEPPGVQELWGGLLMKRTECLKGSWMLVLFPRVDLFKAADVCLDKQEFLSLGQSPIL